MRTQITVTELGPSEKLDTVTKTFFMATNGDKQPRLCMTFKDFVAKEIKVDAVLDVEYEEITAILPSKQHAPAWKVYKIYTGDKDSPTLPQSGTWREEKAAEIIAQLWIAGQLKPKDKLKARLLKWLEDSMPE